jgi:hypothetical protein
MVCITKTKVGRECRNGRGRRRRKRVWIGWSRWVLKRSAKFEGGIVAMGDVW